MTTVANDSHWWQQSLLEAEDSKQSSIARGCKLTPRMRLGTFLPVKQSWSVCAGRIVSCEGVLSWHTLPMAPTIRWEVSRLRQAILAWLVYLIQTKAMRQSLYYGTRTSKPALLLFRVSTYNRYTASSLSPSNVFNLFIFPYFSYFHSYTMPARMPSSYLSTWTQQRYIHACICRFQG